jgi:hypothetical protein
MFVEPLRSRLIGVVLISVQAVIKETLDQLALVVRFLVHEAVVSVIQCIAAIIEAMSFWLIEIVSTIAEPSLQSRSQAQPENAKTTLQSQTLKFSKGMRVQFTDISSFALDSATFG